LRDFLDGTIALSIALPSSTNPNEKISTHDTAKNSVVEKISKLFTSMAKSFLRTSNAVFRNIVSTTAEDAEDAEDQTVLISASFASSAVSLSPPHQRAVAAAQTRRCGIGAGNQFPVAHDRDVRNQPLGNIEIMRRE